MGAGAKPFSPERGLGRGRRRRGALASVLVVLIAVFVATLVVAPGASAERSVVGIVDLEAPPFPDRGPSFTRVGHFAVRSTAAPADAGDLYATGERHVCDQCTLTDGGFAVQYSPAGQVMRLWGPDVVQSGSPGNADETQAVWVKASAGSFTCVL